MKKALPSIISATVIAASMLAGCGTKAGSTSDNMESESTATPADELISRLQWLTDSGLVAYGHHDDVAYGHNWAYIPDSSDVKNVAGDYPAILDWDLGLIEWNTEKQLDGVPFDFIRDQAAKHNAKGGINSFSWHLRNPVTKGDSWDISESDVIAQIMTPGSELNDTIRLWIGRAADFIGSIRDTDGNRVPVIFRPWHEHSGNWFWWDLGHNSPENLVALWHLTREIFDQKGIDNVVWAYSPDKIRSEEQYLSGYPGDEYVDILGSDVYYWNGENGPERFAQHIDNNLGIATKLAKERGKLVALTETGSEGVKPDTWYSEILLPAIANYPICYATAWRNANVNEKPEHFYAPYPGHASAPDFVKFHDNPRTAFLNEMKKQK